MQNFTRRIAVDQNFNPEFFFNRIYTVHGMRYHISVMDGNGQTFAFNMEQKNGSWKIIDAPKLPDWIITIESKLQDAIEKSVD